MYSSSHHHKECRSDILEANCATSAARKQRREKEEQVISLQARIQSQIDLLRKRRELNTSMSRSRQAAEDKVAELEIKLKEKDQNELLMKRRELHMRTIIDNNRMLRKAAENKAATLEIALKKKDEAIQERNQKIELLRGTRMLPNVRLHDANEKLQQEKEKHAQTSRSLRNTMDRHILLQEEYQAQGVRLQMAGRELAEKRQAFENLRAQKDREIHVQLQIRENTIQEMKSKNTQLEKQLCSRDKQISDLERNKEFQYLNRKKQYEEILLLKQRVEELEEASSGFDGASWDDECLPAVPARKRRRS
ncbi:hypothetical protein BDZ89DRAFT_1075563 [Hymenopellis radicata]|nr:hypothetical protein BDZ89DRAFT_1075563 [Hymenopellis radicata]